MLVGAFGYRLPPPGWTPRGWTPPATNARAAVLSVPVDVAWKTRQFWLLWAVLCLNVSAGIGVLGMASPMIQEIFQGRVTASAAAGFAGLLSLFNIGGRLFWASLSDVIGRTTTYTIFFVLGFVLYISVPTAGSSGNLPLFVILFCVILTMYGGGFATIPAYLADVFGVGQVSAIHGRLLTAWSTAGILGPVLVNYLREIQIARGVPAADAYTFTMYLLAGLLVIGFICNLAVRPVPERLFVMSAAPTGAGALSTKSTGSERPIADGRWGLVAAAWTVAIGSLGWGVTKTLLLARQLFSG